VERLGWIVESSGCGTEWDWDSRVCEGVLPSESVLLLGKPLCARFEGMSDDIEWDSVMGLLRSSSTKNQPEFGWPIDYILM
jgi:hypothetical protein